MSIRSVSLNLDRMKDLAFIPYIAFLCLGRKLSLVITLQRNIREMFLEQAAGWCGIESFFQEDSDLA